MSSSLELLKSELERVGSANDGTISERTRRMLNITRETGEFLSVLVRATASRRILEIGTSNGYSALWLAEAARAVGGSVTTLELSDYKAGLASSNFERSGLAAHLVLIRCEAGRFLRDSASEVFDFVFLDSERSEYAAWWPYLRRVLRPGGLLVVDNAVSHVKEMAPLVDLVTKDHAFATSLVPVGNGEFLAVKEKS